MNAVVDSLERSASWIRQAEPRVNRPFLGIVLGSGLGDLVDELTDARALPYEDIPGFPTTTVAGHHGGLYVGELEGVTVVACRGRVHLYEGQPVSSVVHGVRTLCRLGAKALLITNAAGGVNRSYGVGDLMLITDHVNFTGKNPLTGPNDEALGPRFPDMSQAYDGGLRSALIAEAEAQSIPLQRGVYFGFSGPSYETPAEIRMVRTLGADAVGMSTVLEVIAARHMGVRCVGMSVISNEAADEGQELNHEEVAEVADAAGPRLRALVRGLVRRRDAWWESP
ncbi:MAG: purine-nucleoside phosphorylase [Deltaproteobacteria bacterium]|nr:purine-nucleoside phosphorylase [Deltaproteobacteria bacterium]